MTLIEQKVELSDGSDTFVISYVSSGSGKNGIILLPGALGSVDTNYLPQLKFLPDLLPSYKVIAWDPPGYGKSRPPERVFTKDFLHRDAVLAHALMKAVGFDKYSALGWWDGAKTGIILAAKYPEAVIKLIISGTNSYVLPEELEFYESIRDVTTFPLLLLQTLEKIYGKEVLSKMWSDWIDIMHRILVENDGNICKEEVKGVKANTLIVNGANDPLIAKCHTSHLLNSIPTVQYYEFAEGKHNVHLPYAEEFNQIVADFLNN